MDAGDDWNWLCFYRFCWCLHLFDVVSHCQNRFLNPKRSLSIYLYIVVYLIFDYETFKLFTASQQTTHPAGYQKIRIRGTPNGPLIDNLIQSCNFINNERTVPNLPTISKGYKIMLAYPEQTMKIILIAVNCIVFLNCINVKVIYHNNSSPSSSSLSSSYLQISHPKDHFILTD